METNIRRVEETAVRIQTTDGSTYTFDQHTIRWATEIVNLVPDQRVIQTLKIFRGLWDLDLGGARALYNYVTGNFERIGKENS